METKSLFKFTGVLALSSSLLSLATPSIANTTSPTNGTTATVSQKDPSPKTLQVKTSASSGVIMAYYSNWTVYNTKLRHGEAAFKDGQDTIYPPYGLTGIEYQTKPWGDSFFIKNNADANAQIPLLDIIAYAFAEVYPSYSVKFDAATGQWSPYNPSTYVPDNVGKVYLSDPWSDLFVKESQSGGLCDVSKFNNGDPYVHELCLGGYETIISGQTGQPTGTGNSVLNAYLSDPGGYFFSGNLNQFSALTTLNPNIKRIVSIGGWYHEDSFEAGAFASDTAKANFFNSLKEVIDHFKLDGVDLDYEPGFYNTQGYTTANADKFTALIQYLRTNLDQTYGPGKKLITIAVSPNTNTIKIMDGTNGGNWAKIAAAVDYVSVMGYDLHGAFDLQNNPSGAITNFHSNLFATSEQTDPNGNYNADEAVKNLIAYGVPSGKILLGAPSYARAMQGVANNANNGLYQAYTNPSFLGDMDDADDTRHPPQGQQSYYGMLHEEYDTTNLANTPIPAWLTNNGGFYSYLLTNAPDQLAGAYAAWVFNNKGTFASYDTPAVIRTKAQYALQNNLGGMMMWELSSDTSPAETNTSLLCAMASVLHANSSGGKCNSQ